MFEATLYKKVGDSDVRCFLCRHNCLIKDGRRGICMVRENRGGKLFSVFYGKPCALAVDPIEKKPLFHFHPATRSFSVATLGCNFQCEFCQNWDISQYGRNPAITDPGLRQQISPQAIVDKAVESGCESISYTYSEPTIFFEYARDIAMIARPHGIENVFVTNGYMSREALAEAKDWLSAANVDLKAFKKETYKKVMGASLDGVLDSIREMKRLGIWIEITTLVVPGMNDSRAELTDIANFIAGVGKDIPWHISRFHPQYKMTDRPATPAKTIEAAYEIGRAAGLKYVYTGNMAGDARENTYCWKCSELLIERMGFSVIENKIKGTSACPKCSSKIDGIFH
jgi:pyruvate formate lyase activating enzyme